LMNFIKFWMKLFLPFLSIALLFVACKRENSSPQWDVELLTPLIKTSLTANNLVADSLTSIASDGAISLVYDHDIYSTPVDSIFKIKDTVLSNFQTAPFPFILDTNFTFPTPATDFSLNLGSIELT